MDQKNLGKLKRTLLEKIEKECQVIYIMLNIRKALDDLSGKYPLLKFNCNWALHIKINKTSPIKKSLKEADKDLNKIIDFVYLCPLKDQLREFLEELSLPSEIVKKSEKWENFRKLLHRILIDTPFIEPTSSIKSFLLKESSEKSLLCKPGSSIGWNIEYNDNSRAEGISGDADDVLI